MKKAMALILILALLLVFAGCGNEKTEQKTKKNLQIVTTFFPEYDWVMEILGENAKDARVTMLMDNGVDLHSYQPTVQDIAKVGACDLFIYVGGESDAWVGDTLKSASNKEMKVVNLMEVLHNRVKEEEVVEGMQAEESEEEEETETDEHVWLSLKNAQVVIPIIAEKLVEADPANTEIYSANAEAYVGKLADLDARYAEAVDTSAKKTLLFGDRFPFRYLVDDYGIDYYAAFVGCSAESEASFETILFLAGKLDELGLNTVMTTEKSDNKIAQTVIDSSADKDRQILALDAMQSTTMQDVKEGKTYLGTMEKNLEVLKTALN